MRKQSDLSISKQQLQESEILDKKFLELLNSRQHESQQEQYQFEITKFDEDEQQKIKAQFLHISQNKETMDYAQYRESLGLLGRQDSFISRIFHIIDVDKLGTITQEDYLKYIRTIIHGSQFQQQLLGWKIISGGKNQLEIKDLMLLFEEISIVWNALTGEIVQPRKKYIEQLFSILDVDQDDVITFQDYRIFYKSQPLIFGWFEYLNNIDLNDSVTKAEMQKTRNLLQQQIFSNRKTFKNVQQLQQLMQTQQAVIDAKMVQLFKEIESSVIVGNQIIANTSMNSLKSPNKTQIQSLFSHESSLTSFTQLGKLPKSQKLSSSTVSQNPIQQLNRMRRKRQKTQSQQNKDSNSQMIGELQKIMDKCYKAMNACEEFREMKQISSKYTPTKMKLKEVKMQAVSQKQFKFDDSKDEKTQKQKKKNILIYFGHKNWNLVLNIMVGMRKSIRSLYQLNSYLQLKSSHFKEQHQFLLGNKVLNGINKQVYKFIQIAPVVFEKLRNNYGISNLDYQRSVGPESLLNSLLMGNLTGLNEKCSTGKSGAFFYLTLDKKIFLKTIPKRQFLFFIQILQNYYKHMKQFNNTLIVRIYGLYKLKMFKNKKKVDTIYFISMENIFKDISSDTLSTITIKETYDLKGSFYGRNGSEDKELKDNDWVERKRKIHISPELKSIFKNQIKVDSKFFKNNKINDYSLMVSIAEMDLQTWNELKSRKGPKPINVFKQFKGGILGENPGEFYILSIIDILTVFEIRKTFQYAFKSTFLSKDVSCIPPPEYCKRFREFLYQIVQEDTEITTNLSE